MRKDNRYVVELPSGVIKNPQLHIAGDDFDVNDVVWLDKTNNVVMPMYDNTHDVYGIVAAIGKKGKNVLIAAK